MYMCHLCAMSSSIHFIPVIVDQGIKTKTKGPCSRKRADSFLFFSSLNYLLFFFPFFSFLFSFIMTDFLKLFFLPQNNVLYTDIFFMLRRGEGCSHSCSLLFWIFARFHMLFLVRQSVYSQFHLWMRPMKIIWATSETLLLSIWLLSLRCTCKLNCFRARRTTIDLDWATAFFVVYKNLYAFLVGTFCAFLCRSLI